MVPSPLAASAKDKTQASEESVSYSLERLYDTSHLPHKIYQGLTRSPGSLYQNDGRVAVGEAQPFLPAMSANLEALIGFLSCDFSDFAFFYAS